MTRKAFLSFLLSVVMTFIICTPAFAAAPNESATAQSVAVVSSENMGESNAFIDFVRDFFAGVKAFFTRLFPFLRTTKRFPTDNVRKKYGDSVAALDSYADYAFSQVQAKPLVDVSFDDIDNLDRLADSEVGLSDSSGAYLTTGRFGLRQALALNSPDTYITLPDKGEQDALTISLWINARDLQTREDTAQPRVSTLLDTDTGAGHVTLKFVHTGTPSYADPESGDAVMGTNSTKLVFVVEGNSGGSFEDSGVFANNTQFCNFEYTMAEKYAVGSDAWVVHPEGHCWFHIGVVYEPEKGDVTFYHCGKLDSTKHFDTAVKPVLNGVRIGAGNAEGAYFDGTVDDIRIYGQALTQADMDILADYERDMWVNRTACDWEESTTVLYVNGKTGSDENPGTEDAPFATVKKGVESIAAPGTKLIIAPGLYREAGINLTASGTALQPVIIEAEAPGETVLSASVPFDGWRRTMPLHVYENDWSYDYPCRTDTPGNAIIGRSDLILVDGEPIAPVLNKKDLRNNSYYIDTAADKIYLKTRKALGKCNVERALPGENGAGAYILDTNSSDYVVLRGLSFTNCATMIWGSSMVEMHKPQHILVEDCIFNNSGTAGLGFEHGSNDRTVEDVLIRRCSFRGDCMSGIGAGFRSMNFVVEDCEFTSIGKKIDWGQYDAADPATTKMMVCKNVTWRGCRFAHNTSNDLWFDNYNWNIDVDSCCFVDNTSGIAVHIEIDVPGVRVKNSVLDGGIRLASAEGAVLDNNIFHSNDNPLIDHWGMEYRYGIFGPVYTWKNTVLTNNTFYCGNKWKTESIFDLPPHESFYDMYANGNRFYVKNGLQIEKSYRVQDKKCDFKTLVSAIGDANAEFLCRNPFVNDGTATVSFRDKASAANGYVARNQVPVELSKPLNEECTVYYTVWDYDAETVIREGEIHFDKFEQQKWIHVGDSDRNTLVEVSGIQNIGLGENSFHYRKAS